MLRCLYPCPTSEQAFTIPFHCVRVFVRFKLLHGPEVFGKMPVWAISSLQKILQARAKRAKITKQIVWHTFRNTYSSLCSECGSDVKLRKN